MTDTRRLLDNALGTVQVIGLDGFIIGTIKI